MNLATEVLLGTDNLLSNDGFVVSIKERFVHPNFDTVLMHNDIALIKLNESVKFTSKIYPACIYMDNNGPADGTDLIVTGFGQTNKLSMKMEFNN